MLEIFLGSVLRSLNTNVTSKDLSENYNNDDVINHKADKNCIIQIQYEYNEMVGELLHEIIL